MVPLKVLQVLSSVTATLSHAGRPVLAFEHRVPGRDGGDTEIRVYQELPEVEGPHDVVPVVVRLLPEVDIVVQQWSEVDPRPVVGGVGWSTGEEYVDEYAFIPRAAIVKITRPDDPGYEADLKEAARTQEELFLAFAARQ